MKFIAHRGNIWGPEAVHENHPQYVIGAIQAGFHVEVDCHFLHGKWFFGHNHPQFYSKMNFLKIDGVLCHAKNVNAVKQLVDYCKTQNGEYHWFWHQEDAYTMTNLGYIVVYPGCKIPDTTKTIVMMPEMAYDMPNVVKILRDLPNIYGVCSDYVGQIKEELCDKSDS